MGAEQVIRWYGVSDKCGDVDDSSQYTEEDARARMWTHQDHPGKEFCWDCVEAL